MVHVVVGGEIGGAERMLADLASNEASGAEHTVALLSPLESVAELFRERGIAVFDRGRTREGPLPFLLRTLGPADVAWVASILEKTGAHVAHLHTFGSQVLGTRAARRAGSRVLRTEHSTRVYEDPTCWAFSRWSLARTDAVVAVSEHVRRIAERRAPWAGSRLRVVTNGVDVDRFGAVERRHEGPFTFALVGRLEPRKGVDLALSALSRLPRVRLEVAGGGTDLDALKTRAGALGIGDRVRFHAALDDVRGVLAGADAMLCSSRREGLGLALLEGMATGLPVVGFAVGGVPETVVDGETGLLCLAGDVDALVSVMKDAVSGPDRMRAMGVAARRHVIERFSLRSMSEGYAEVYATLRGL